MQNIDVLIDYMHQADFLAPDGSVRSISLAEQGYTSSFGEDYQSASLVYSYLMAASYPDIDAFLLFRQTDNAHEMESNLALGLNNLDGTHKPAYYFYQAMGAANQQEYIDKASNIIGMDVQYLVDNRILQSPPQAVCVVAHYLDRALGHWLRHVYRAISAQLEDA
jgi:hypothetical protein